MAPSKRKSAASPKKGTILHLCIYSQSALYFSIHQLTVYARSKAFNEICANFANLINIFSWICWYQYPTFILCGSMLT